MISIEDVMNFLIEERAPYLDPKVLANMFDRMIWTLNDNGAEITKVTADWVEGDDEYKVEVALLMEESFPYNDRATMEEQFSRLRGRWPRFGTLCERVLQQWDMTMTGKRQG